MGSTFEFGGQSLNDGTFTVRKISAVIPVSREMAMDCGIIPDTRPPAPPPTRRQRFRWWRQEKWSATRMRLASWLAGFDVTDRY